jgi:hypothetical protein
MSIRKTTKNLVKTRQQELDERMIDRNGKRLVVGDVVEYKKDYRGAKFIKKGIVLGGYESSFGEYYVKVSSSIHRKKFITKRITNIRKVNRNKAVLFKLENA